MLRPPGWATAPTRKESHRAIGTIATAPANATNSGRIAGPRLWAMIR